MANSKRSRSPGNEKKPRSPGNGRVAKKYDGEEEYRISEFETIKPVVFVRNILG